MVSDSHVPSNCWLERKTKSSLFTPSYPSIGIPREDVLVRGMASIKRNRSGVLNALEARTRTPERFQDFEDDIPVRSSLEVRDHCWNYRCATAFLRVPV